MEQTAVEFLVAEISKSGIGKHTMIVHKQEIEAAKKMEKQQIIDAYQSGNISMMSAEQYYNEKFKNK